MIIGGAGLFVSCAMGKGRVVLHQLEAARAVQQHCTDQINRRLFDFLVGAAIAPAPSLLSQLVFDALALRQVRSHKLPGK